MTRIALGLALAAFLGAAAQADPPGYPQNGTYGGVYGKGHPICILTYQIKDVRTPDSRTLLFRMNDGTVWKNSLVNDCNGLTYSNGFVYIPTPPNVICENLQLIRVRRTQSVCKLGAFTRYTPPSKTKSNL